MTEVLQLDPSNFNNKVTIHTLNNIPVYGLTNKSEITCKELFEKMLKNLNYRTKYVDMSCLHFSDQPYGNPYPMDYIIDLTTEQIIHVIHMNIKNNCEYAEELDLQTKKTIETVLTSNRKKCLDNFNEIKKNTKRSLEQTFIDKPVSVISLTGQTTKIIVSSNTFVYELRLLIEKELNIPVDLQRLVIRGTTMADEKELGYYLIKYIDSTGNIANINNTNSIYLVMRLRGGMFHETSGRDGYDGLLQNYFSLDW